MPLCLLTWFITSRETQRCHFLNGNKNQNGFFLENWSRSWENICTAPSLRKTAAGGSVFPSATEGKGVREKSGDPRWGVGVRPAVSGVPWGQYTSGCTRWQGLPARAKGAAGMVFAWDRAAGGEHISSAMPKTSPKDLYLKTVCNSLSNAKQPAPA